MKEFLLDRIGTDTVMTVVRDFYDRVFVDSMIGHMFEGKNKERFIRKEAELVGRVLGGHQPYTGRPMPLAHRNLVIFDGHFDRRMQILRETLADHHVDQAVQDRWLGHSESLRRMLVAGPADACG